MTGVLSEGTIGAVTQHEEKPHKMKAKTEVRHLSVTKNVSWPSSPHRLGVTWDRLSLRLFSDFTLI